MNKISDIVGLKIKSLREEKKLTQEELSATAGLSRTYLANLELGNRKNITIDSLAKITDALEISLSDFFSYLQPSFLELKADPSLLSNLVEKVLTMDAEGQKDVLEFTAIIHKWSNKQYKKG